MHADVRPHASKGVALVATDGATEGLDTAMGVHVSLSGSGCRAHDITARALPPTRPGDTRALVGC